jgi:hypothetical protein
MILHPPNWPHLVLPLVKRGGGMHDAAVFCPPLNATEIPEDTPIRIYLSNMFVDWRNAETKTYPNVDALLDDGWVVD